MMLRICSDVAPDISLPDSLAAACEIAGCLDAKKSPGYVYIIQGDKIIADRAAIAEYARQHNRPYTSRLALAHR
jgi:hypothetical protein